MSSSPSPPRAAGTPHDLLAPSAPETVDQEQDALSRVAAAEEHRYRLAVESAELGIWDFDPASGHLTWDARCKALFGLDETARVDQDRFIAALHPDDRARVQAAAASALDPAGDGRYAVEHRSIGVNDGATRWLAARGRALFEGDRPVRFLGTMRDITAAKAAEHAAHEEARRSRELTARLERERERLLVELNRSNEDLDQFAYVTSHDLKAPLRGIANLSQWVEEDLAEVMSDEGREQMRLLRGRVNRLEALINGILSYSRAGRIPERVERVDTGLLAREVVARLAPTTGVQVAIPEDLPTIDAERAPLHQVLMNLVGNAVKYASKSDPRVAITCSPTRDGHSFMVKDNGAGIAPAFHQRIWTIFQTLEPRDRVEATGIGLSIVKKIVERRGGHVWVVSVPGAGAEFHFSWPSTVKSSP